MGFLMSWLEEPDERPEHLLLDFVAAVLDNSLHLLVYKFYTTKARLFKSSDLTLHQKLKTHLHYIQFLRLSSDNADLTSGTNKAGLGPLLFLMAVKMSMFDNPVNG